MAFWRICIEKSPAEKSPAASDGRGFFSVCDSRLFYTTGILYILLPQRKLMTRPACIILTD
jgi:hypothetical protein